MTALSRDEMVSPNRSHIPGTNHKQRIMDSTTQIPPTNATPLTAAQRAYHNFIILNINLIDLPTLDCHISDGTTTLPLSTWHALTHHARSAYIRDLILLQRNEDAIERACFALPPTYTLPM